MKVLRGRIQRDERGASLILAIAFMLVAGAIGAGVTTAVSSGINDSSTLAVARDREYAAEGAINYAIVQMRATQPASSIGLTSCQNPYLIKSFPLRGTSIDIRVDCYPAPDITTALSASDSVILSARNNVIFVACDATSGQACDASSGSPPKVPAPAIIRAEINFQVSGTTVSGTYVQSWSVNG